MHVPIPRWLIQAWNGFGRWGNVPVRKFGRYELLRLDILLVLGGIICMSYYGWLNGWQGAMFGLAVYVMFLVLALIFRR